MPASTVIIIIIIIIVILLLFYYSVAQHIQYTCTHAHAALLYSNVVEFCPYFDFIPVLLCYRCIIL